MGAKMRPGWRRLFAIAVPVSLVTALSVGVVWAQRGPTSGQPVTIAGQAAVTAPTSSNTGPTSAPTVAPSVTRSGIPTTGSTAPKITRAPAGPAPTVGPARGSVSPAPASAAGRTIDGPGLWLMARDGSGLRRMLADAPESVAWSPDDSHVAVGRNNGIDLVSRAGGATTHLATFPGTVLVGSLSWSPDGHVIAANIMHNPRAMYGMTSELFMVDAASGATTSWGPIGGAVRPTWSVQGCLGSVSQTVDIRCPGSAALNLPPFPGSDQFTWSPDGTRYAITSSHDATAGALLTFRADGSDQVDLGNRQVIPMTWVGDGRSIVFQFVTDRTGQLWAQPVTGGPARALADAIAYAVNGVDDGITIGTGHSTGHHAIVSLSVSNPIQRRLVDVDAAGGAINRLTWARDGKWLLAETSPSA